MNRGFNLKAGINYCAPVGRIGFRGVRDNLARLIIIPGDIEKEIGFFHGVDVPAEKLPYLPDMSAGSDFEKSGYWHHYEIDKSIFIVHLTCVAGSIFEMRTVLEAVLFLREEKPRIFADNRESLRNEGVLSLDDLAKIDKLAEFRRIIL